MELPCPRSAWDQLAGFFEARAVPGVEEANGSRYVRSLAFDGTTGVLELSHSDGLLHVRILSGDLDPALVEQRCRRAFDLDVDLTEVTAVLRADPILRPTVDGVPGLRVPGAFDGNEIAVRAILGQQISVKGAATLAGRLVAAYGEPLDAAVGSVTSTFPTPDAIAAADLSAVGMPESRRRTLRAVAAGLASGEVRLEPGVDPVATKEQLIDFPGIGEWTASYVCMRALGDRDAFLPGDLGVRKGAAALGLPTSIRALSDHAERWRPWRAYAVMYLWRAIRAAPEPRRRLPGSDARRSKP